MADLNDIQGNILAGFNTDFQVFIGLSKPENANWPNILQWLAGLATEVSTYIDVKEERRKMIAVEEKNRVWLGVAVSGKLMAETQPDVLFRDDAYRKGMTRRAAPILGDRTPPDEWVIGGVNSPVDILLTVASNDQDGAEAKAMGYVTTAAAAGLSVSYQETAKRFKNLEHFGFQDGISQPLVKGIDPDGEYELGKFVFGYPQTDGGPPVSALSDNRDIMKNGSLMVVRRLEQDVALFRSFCSLTASQLQTQSPGLNGDQLQAHIVGRWPQGALFDSAESSDPGPVTNNNDFDFSGDPDAKSCPFGAHIRKVNPRNGPRDVVDVPRMIRRGIPFGEPYDEDNTGKRGLLFVSFQTSIVNTFEFLSSKWMNVPEKPGPNSGHDLLVGRSSGPRSMSFQGSNGKCTITAPGQDWVIPTGGCYLFAPGKSALSKFADEPVFSLSTAILRKLQNLSDSFSAF